MHYPLNSKMPMAAGIAMAVWAALCYLPTYFSPDASVGYIARGGFWMPFALLSAAPVILFFIYAFGLAKTKPKTLLVP